VRLSPKQSTGNEASGILEPINSIHHPAGPGASFFLCLLRGHSAEDTNDLTHAIPTKLSNTIIAEGIAKSGRLPLLLSRKWNDSFLPHCSILSGKAQLQAGAPAENTFPEPDKSAD
jgi:hypothetical protein